MNRGGDIVLFGMPTSIPPALLSHTFVSEFPTSQGRKEKKNISNSIALFIYEESLLTIFQSIRLDFRYQILMKEGISSIHVIRGMKHHTWVNISKSPFSFCMLYNILLHFFVFSNPTMS